MVIHDDTVTPAQPLRIWVLDYGVMGHSVQTAGVVRLLQESGLKLEVSQLTFEVTLRGWMRGFMKKALPRLPLKISGWMVRRFHRGLAIPPGKPDVLVASGGTSLWLMQALARETKAKTVYVGFPGDFPKSWYQTLVSPIPLEGYQKVVETPRIVTGMTPEVVAEAAEKSGHKVCQKGLVTVLIGGRSRSHQYEEGDWRALAEGLNALGKAGSRFLLTTSRRTGEVVEALLRSLIREEYLVDAVWWSTSPRKVMREFLGRGEMVLATRDSLTMVGEAIDSNRPVWTLTPQIMNLPKGSKLARYFEKLAEAGVLRSVPTGEVATCDPYELVDAGDDWQRVGDDLVEVLRSF